MTVQKTSVSGDCQHRSMAGQADQLAAEFGACAEGGDDRPRFIAAVEKAHRMRGELGALGVYMSVTDTDSDHPSTVAGAAKGRRKNRFRFFAKWVRWCSSISA